MRRTVLISAFCFLMFATVALAARPGYYRGRNSHGSIVEFRVTRDGRFVTKVDFGTTTNCSGFFELREPGRMRIHSNHWNDLLNKFGVHDTEEGGIAVTGRFLSHGRAKGTAQYEDRGCIPGEEPQDKRVTWTASWRHR